MGNDNSEKRMHLRGPIIVTHVKLGDERKYFFGYAKNISRSGIFIQTITPKEVGEVFNIEFTIPKTDISVNCSCKVIWNRKYSEHSKYDPGMGLRFEDLSEATADSIEKWIIENNKEEEED